MVRNLLLVALILAVLCGVAYLFFDLSDTGEEHLNAWDLVPNDAALIWEHKGFPATWQRVTSTNLIWSGLQEAPLFAALDSALQAMDQHFSGNAKWQADLDQAKVLLSVHADGEHQPAFLFLVSLPQHVAAKSRQAYLQAHLQKANGTVEESFDAEQRILTLTTRDHGTVHFTLVEGVLIASANKTLLKKAIRQAQHPDITQGRAFQKVRRTMGPGRDGALFIQSSAMEGLLGAFLQPQPKLPGSWMELDLNIQPNRLELTGMVDSSTSNAALLTLAWGQEGRTSVVEYAPKHTALLYAMALSDRSTFIKALEERGGRDPRLVRQWSDSLNIDLDQALLSWMDEEIGKIVVPQGDSTTCAFVFGTSSERKAQEELLTLGNRIDEFLGEQDVPRPTFLHRETEVRSLMQPALFKQVLGNQFSELVQPYYAILGSRVVCSDHLGTLRSIINAVVDGQTLSTDPAYRALSEHTSERNSLFCYASLPRFHPIFTEMLSADHAAQGAEWEAIWKDMGAVVLQLAPAGNGMAFVNLTVRHQPAELVQSNALWEADLEAPLALKPQLLSDHNSGALDVLVQDEANNIYLFSNTGKELWRAALSGRIKGQVHQVDRYKNGKLQMLFNTEDKIFLVDRNGNNVEGFPITLDHPVSAPLALFDYDSDRNYRILQPLANGQSVMYDINGKRVKGWKAKQTDAPVRYTPKHIRIRNKDYIYLLDTLGKQHVLDRQGKVRYGANAQVPFQIPAEAVVLPGVQIGETRLIYHNDHQLVVWTIDGDLDTLDLKVDSPVLGMVHTALAGGEMGSVLATANKLLVVQDRQMVQQVPLEAGLAHGPFRFNFNDGEMVGVTTQAEEGVWLFDAIGPLPDMPLKGNTAFSIGDLNRDGRFELVVGSGGQLLVHQLR